MSEVYTMNDLKELATREYWSTIDHCKQEFFNVLSPELVFQALKMNGVLVEELSKNKYVLKRQQRTATTKKSLWNNFF